MNAFKRICAAIIGMVFFVAGVLKLMDPVGAGLIVEAWLRFLHLGFLAPAAPVLGFALSLSEALLGAALVTGVWRKAVACLAAALISVFTLLTLLSLLFKPDMDCGCFGEALHLTPLQSLIKNLVLCLLWAVAFLPLRRLGGSARIKSVSFGLTALSLLALGIWSIGSVPPIDYTPLHPGAELAGAYDDNFYDITTYVYEKNGRRGSFTRDCPPDSSWVFVGVDTLQRGIGVKDGLPQPLPFRDLSGTYCDTLATRGPVLLLSAYAPGRLGEKRWQRLSALALRAMEKGIVPILLVSAPESELDALIPDSALRTRAYLSDRKTLMTLNRSNGGATFVHDGQVVRKWPLRALPGDKDLGRMLRHDPTEVMMVDKNNSRTHFLGFCLYVTAVMFLL